jgi:two-component sensor histidine kinase
MNTSEEPDRDAALSWLAHACDELALPNRPAAQANEPSIRSTSAQTLKHDAKPTNLRRTASRPWSWGARVAATIGLTLLSMAGIAWLSLRDRQAPTTTASSATASAKPLENVAGVTDAGRSPLPRQTPGGSVSDPALAASREADRQSFHEQTSMLSDLRHQIDELRVSQSQLSQANAGLTQRLKATLETTQNNANRIEELKFSQAQLVAEKESAAARLNAGQQQLTAALDQLKSIHEEVADIDAQLKSAQEQVARLTAQKSRPKAIPPAGQLVVNSPQRPARPALPPQRVPLLRTSPAQQPH